MPKFKFQLEGVLRQRKQVERQRQRELAIVQAEMNQLTAQLKELESSTQAATQDLRTNRLTGKLDMSFIAAHRRFMLGVQRQGMALVQKMSIVQQKIEAARLQLFEAAKGRKIIEKLREKQLDRWKQEVSRKELAELDEVSMQLSYWHGVGDVAAEGQVEEVES
jgi:flagellar FliJ protein